MPTEESRSDEQEMYLKAIDARSFLIDQINIDMISSKKDIEAVKIAYGESLTSLEWLLEQIKNSNRDSWERNPPFYFVVSTALITFYLR